MVDVDIDAGAGTIPAWINGRRPFAGTPTFPIIFPEGHPEYKGVVKKAGGGAKHSSYIGSSKIE